VTPAALLAQPLCIEFPRRAPFAPRRAVRVVARCTEEVEFVAVAAGLLDANEEVDVVGVLGFRRAVR
jgi:hypothetical protein